MRQNERTSQKFTTFHYYSTKKYLNVLKFAAFTSVSHIFILNTMDMINYKSCCLYNIIIEIPNSACLRLPKEHNALFVC